MASSSESVRRIGKSNAYVDDCNYMAGQDAVNRKWAVREQEARALRVLGCYWPDCGRLRLHLEFQIAVVRG
jgi:hypothetical protein